MATLSGVAAGAAVGGVAGGLIGLGVPEFEAKSYEGKIRGGNILVAVHTDNSESAKRTKQVFESNGAHDIAVTWRRLGPEQARAHLPVLSSERGRRQCGGALRCALTNASASATRPTSSRKLVMRRTASLRSESLLAMAKARR